MFSLILSAFLVGISASPSVERLPVKPPARPGLISVLPSDNLVNLLNKAKANSNFQLALNGNYTANGTILIVQPNISLDLNGSSLALIPSPGASSNIAVHAAHFEMFNGTVSEANVMVRSYGDHTFIHDLKSINTINQFFLGDVGSTNALLQHVTVGMTNSVSVYWTQDNFTISNSSLAGSNGEYVLREEVPAVANPPLPKNALISNVVAHNHNAFGKQAIGIRMGSAVIENSVVDGNIRIGQAGASGIGSNNPSFVIKNTQFVSLDSPQLALIQGVNATVDSCTFLSDGITRNIAIDGLTQAVLLNNLQHPSKPGITVKSLWATLIAPGSASYPKVTETGTKLLP